MEHRFLKRIISAAVGSVVLAAFLARSETPRFAGEFTISNVVEYAEGVSYRVDGAYQDLTPLGYDATNISTGDLVFIETSLGDVDVWRITNIVAADTVNAQLDVRYLPVGSTSRVGMVAGVAAICTLDNNFPMRPSETGARVSEHLLNEIRNYSFRLITNATGGSGTITNIISPDNSVIISNGGGPEVSLSVTAHVDSAVASWATKSASTRVDFDGQVATNVEAIYTKNTYVKLGQNTLASAAYAVAIGVPAKAAGGAVAIGRNANATNTESITIGYNTYADGTNATAIGSEAEAGANGVALGSDSYAGADAVALGAGVRNSAANTTRIKGNLDMQGAAITNCTYFGDWGAFVSNSAVNAQVVASNALPKSWTNAAVLPALTLTGGGTPATGAILVSTNAAGCAAWKPPSYVCAYLVAITTAVPKDVVTVVTNWTEYTDLLGEFNPTTGIFTASSPGIYEVTANLSWVNVNAGYSYYGYIFAGDATTFHFHIAAASLSDFPILLHSPAYASSAGTQCKVAAYHNSPDNLEYLRGHPSSAVTWIKIISVVKW